MAEGVKLSEIFTQWSLKADLKPLEDLQSQIGGLVTKTAAIGASIGAAAGSIFAFAKSTADAGDEAFNTAMKVGMTIQSYQEMAYAASLSNVAHEEFAASMNIFNKNLNEAQQGTKEQVAVYNKLGVSLRNVDGGFKTTDEMIVSIAEKFATMQDGTSKSALALDIFGRSGAKLIPLLNEGSAGIEKFKQEARDLGIVLTKEQAMAGDEFNDNLDRLKYSLIGVRNVIGNELIPILSPLFLRIKDVVVANRQLIASKVSAWLNAASTYISIMVKWISALYGSIGRLVDAFGGLDKVLKIVAIGFAVFAGMSILSSIGKVTRAVYELYKAFTLLTAMELLMPILIGAAVVAIGLIIEDVITFFQGGESYTGDLVESLKSLFTWLSDVYSGFSGLGKIVTTTLLTPIRMLTAAIANLLDMWKFATGQMSIEEAGGKAFDRMKNVFMPNMDDLGSVTGFNVGGDKAAEKKAPTGALPAFVNAMSLPVAQRMSTVGSAENPTMSSAIGLTPMTAPVSTPGISGEKNVSQKNETVINQTINAVGQNAVEIGNTVATKTDDAMTKAMRSAGNTFKSTGIQ